MDGSPKPVGSSWNHRPYISSHISYINIFPHVPLYHPGLKKSLNHLARDTWQLTSWYNPAGIWQSYASGLTAWILHGLLHQALEETINLMDHNHMTIWYGLGTVDRQGAWGEPCCETFRFDDLSSASLAGCVQMQHSNMQKTKGPAHFYPEKQKKGVFSCNIWRYKSCQTMGQSQYIYIYVYKYIYMYIYV